MTIKLLHFNNVLLGNVSELTVKHLKFFLCHDFTVFDVFANVLNCQSSMQIMKIPTENNFEKKQQRNSIIFLL